MKILHVLSQRPMRTGSGVTLDALVREAARAGHAQAVVCGVPADDPRPSVGDLPADRIHPLVFDAPLYGMSDVMPYPSRRFSDMTPDDLARYRADWLAHLRRLDFRPDVVHAHHLWILGALLKDVFDVPVVSHCHATGLRQMALCPDVDVLPGLRRNDAFCVLFEAHAEQLRGLGLGPVHVVGAGYREDLFFFAPAERKGRLAYAGKYSEAKGLPQLLDAIALRPDVELHVAGAGDAALAARMEAMPNVVLHGRLEQPALAELLRSCHALVLPSFYEGLPLVLVEALACGCRLIATDLPGVRDSIAPHVAPYLDVVVLPRRIGPDRPEPADVPAFVARLGDAIDAAMARPSLETAPDLRRFTWRGVFDRVEPIWSDLAG